MEAEAQQLPPESTGDAKKKSGRESWTCNTSNTALNEAMEAAFIASGETSKNKFLEQFLLTAITGTVAVAVAPEPVRVDDFVERMAAIPGLMAVYETRAANNFEDSFETFLAKAIDFAVNNKKYLRNWEFAVPKSVKVDFGVLAFDYKKIV